MSDIIYERHRMANPNLPFIFHNIFVPDKKSGIINWHDNTEFLCCTDGEGFVNCDSNYITIKKGDTFIVNAGCLHAISSDTKFQYLCLIVDNSFFNDNGIDIESTTFCEKICDAALADKMKAISSVMKKKDDALHVARTRLAVLDYVCYVTENYSVTSIGKRGKISKGYTAVLDAIEYINNHFAEKLTLDEISSRAGFSRYHFARIFKENTGFTLAQHINARRCDRGAYLLREKKKTISQICQECGFDSPSYFAKSFKKIYGLLPSEYRNSFSRR